ncbi:MAG: alpha-L-fucosidase [candidate division KSB1 bacterium]|nr:alpha-L-fucosidase [candidate division KSB1 bacterium]
MIRQLIRLTIAVLFAVPTFAQEPASAEHLRKDFLTWKFGMFIHFNMATYHNCEWALGYEDPATFKPEKLDCNQWAEAAASAGMKYAVLTVKHTGGWCLWDSKQTKTHAMSAFPHYKNGKGDIVREFVKACRKHNLKVGLYYCFPSNFGVPKNKRPLNGLPPEAEGDPISFIKKQLTELFTDYGQIDLLWCDQYQFNIREHWQEIVKHVKALQPNCIVIANNSLDLKETDIYSYEYPWLKTKRRRALPPEDNETPSEVCDKMGPAWFWKARENASNIKSAEQVVKMARLCNSRKANYLLNVAPDKSGLIPVYSLERLKEIGSLLNIKEPQRSGPQTDDK